MDETIYECVVCGHQVTETEYNNMTEDDSCPDCGVTKEDYVLKE